MVKICGSTIKMIKGDTAKIQVGIYDSDGNAYTPIEGDQIRFALKRSYSDEEPLFTINIPIDTLLLVIEPEYTSNLSSNSLDRKYKYDIQITQYDGTVDTFISGELILKEEVD